MESRARAILPIIAIVLVVLIALTAFFVTRRIRTGGVFAKPTPTEAADDLIFPSGTNTAQRSATPRPTVGGVNRVPTTGPEDDIHDSYSTTLDNSGFREKTITVKAATQVTWINLGTNAQTLSFQGVASEAIAANQKYAYAFATPSTYTITSSTGSTQVVTVK